MTFLSKTHNPTQTMKENEETGEYVPAKEEDKSPETNLNETEVRDIFQCEDQKNSHKDAHQGE